MQENNKKWKKLDLPGLPCEINDLGHVRNIVYIKGGMIHKNRRVPAVRCGNRGFFAITRYDGVKQRNYYIHRLVAETFLPNPENLPCVKFKDGDRTNFKASNLYWSEK